RGEWSPEDTPRVLAITVRLATFEFAIGEVEASQKSLQRAEELLAQVGEQRDSQARLAWLRALVARWSGDYRRALAEAVAAVGYYPQKRHPASVGPVTGM